MICPSPRLRDPVVSGTQSAAAHHVLRADPLSVRDVLGTLCRDLVTRCSCDLLGRLELVLAEALNNIVEHAEAHIARAGRIHLVVKTHTGGLSCLIIDRGQALPDACLAPRSLPSHDHGLREGGFGWYLIQDLAREIRYERAGGRNYLAFTIPLHEQPANAA